MNTEHTPGPWHVDYAQGIMTQDGAPIAYVCDDYSGTPSPDARLIAAAPDLLEALKGFVLMFELTGNRLFSLSGKPTTYDKAKAAIAKAEGKA